MDDRDSDSIADEDKTNVNELAEDRTQRDFDSALAPRADIHSTMSDTTGENVIDGGRGFGRLQMNRMYQCIMKSYTSKN